MYRECVRTPIQYLCSSVQQLPKINNKACGDIFIGKACNGVSLPVFSTMRELVWVVFVLVGAMWGGVEGIRFDVSANTRRCISEELRPEVLVVGNYSVTVHPAMLLRCLVWRSRADPLISLTLREQVVDPNGVELYDN